MINYKNTFDEMKLKLTKVGAEIKRDETELPIMADEISYNEEAFKCKIGSDVFNLYSTLNGVDFDWRLKYGDNYLSGFFYIHSFYETMMDTTENKLWVDWYEQDDINEIKKHRIFETIAGTDYYITIKIEPLTRAYKLYYVPEGSVNHGGSKKLKEIPLSIEQYF